MEREGLPHGAAGDVATPGADLGSGHGDGIGSARMRRAWWFGGTLVLAVLVATIAVAWNDLRVRRDAGERYLGALVDSHARQSRQQLDSIERALHGLANGLEALRDMPPMAADVFGREQVARIASGHPHVTGLRVELARPAFAPRETGSGYVMHLGPPARVADGHWVIPLSMPFDRDAAGVPARWLRADLDAAMFTEVLSLHEVGADGLSSVLTTGGILVARSDSGTRHAGLDASASPVFAATADPARGVVQARSLLDGVTRLVGYHRIEGRPLLATVGMTPDALYGGWRAFVAVLATGVLVLVSAWLLGMHFLGRAAARESRMRRDIAVGEHAVGHLRLLRRAVEASEEGVFVLGARRADLVYGNAAFAALTGIDPDDHGPLRRAAVHAITDPVVRGIVRNAMVNAQDVHVELADRRDPGDVRDLEVRLTPVLDRDGTASHFVGVVNDVTLRKRAAVEMAFRASHDALTGLANRDALVRDIDDAIAAGQRPLAVCHLDLDRFQLVNDSLGHDLGDELLVRVARRLESAAGSGARVARLGGDEFGILLPLDPDEGVAARLEALRAAVAGPTEIRGAALRVTPSVGYSCHPDDGSDATTLLRAAVQAGAQAKRRGRNRSVAYRREFDSRAGQRLRLVQELHRALERDEFALVFQLQFNARGKPCGMETLVRWRHPGRGLLAPDSFIDACEESGLILPLGRWVLREAVRHWCLLDREGWGALRIAVNVSALQFQEGLVEDVQEVIDASGLPGDRLELELTESVLLARPAEARRAMEALSARGASLAIDDFGTGYSSLAYLKNLPLQRLKMDQFFVRDLGRDPESEAICAAILRMAHGLGLAVVAEGVETQAQHQWLAERGCDEFQGYLLARPAPFDEVLERLRATRRPVPGSATGLA